MTPTASSGNVSSSKQYRTTINLPNNRGHLSLTSQEKPETILNAFVKSLDTQLFSEQINDKTWYIHDGDPDGQVIGGNRRANRPQFHVPTFLQRRPQNDFFCSGLAEKGGEPLAKTSTNSLTCDGNRGPVLSESALFCFVNKCLNSYGGCFVGVLNAGDN